MSLCVSDWVGDSVNQWHGDLLGCLKKLVDSNFTNLSLKGPCQIRKGNANFGASKLYLFVNKL